MRTLIGDERAQFDAALRARNLIPPKDVIADGGFHRCDVRSRNGRRDGSYVVFGDGVIPAGGICNWQDGFGFEAWRYQPHGRQRTMSEDAEADKKVEEARKHRDIKIAEDRKRMAAKAERLWEAAEPATATHPYLKKKRVQPCSTRILYGCLVVPLHDADGNVHSIQFIDADGEKRFLKVAPNTATSSRSAATTTSSI
jgi:putative DNA primase/helicase